jgi:SAM-dependent methyltransferase
MAISLPHYLALRALYEAGELPQGAFILEIGEGNWYGDAGLDLIRADIDKITDDDRRCELCNEMARIWEERNEEWVSFRIVKLIYRMFLDCVSVRSVDMDGTPEAERVDLNSHEDGPSVQHGTIDCAINHGTAEHIFNIANVFRIMHDAVKVGGLMIHESPFAGWVDHGFYTLQPTLFYDVAAANDYDIRYLAIEHIESKLLHQVRSREEIHELAREGKLPNNAMLYVAMRKTNGDEFKIPMQGVYARNVSQQTVEAWRALR